jgi:hypothetical protein
VSEGMLVDRIGRASRFAQACGPRVRFSGELDCGANYGPADKVFWIVLTAVDWADPASDLTQFSSKKTILTHSKDRTCKNELRSGGKVMVRQGPHSSVALWVSKSTVIEILFFHLIPEQEQFVQHYLTEFPSSLE